MTHAQASFFKDWIQGTKGESMALRDLLWCMYSSPKTHYQWFRPCGELSAYKLSRALRRRLWKVVLAFLFVCHHSMKPQPLFSPPNNKYYITKNNGQIKHGQNICSFMAVRHCFHIKLKSALKKLEHRVNYLDYLMSGLIIVGHL